MKKRLRFVLFVTIWIFILVHFLKDITQDILRIPTFLDLFGDAKEDLSILPAFFQHLFTVLGYGSFIAEIFILISIPIVLKIGSNSRLERVLIIVVILLLIYFLSAVLLDPRFSKQLT